MARFAEIVVDVPGLDVLTYELPQACPEDAVGRLAIVPLGRRRSVGIVVGVGAAAAIERDKIRPVLRVLPIPPLGADWLRLTRFAAAYYQHGWGEVAVGALPPLLRRVPSARTERLATGADETLPGPGGPAEHAVPLSLSDEQTDAVAAIVGAQGFKPFLLFGVTGSGKTEVYLRAIEDRLRQQPDAQVLLLVPEINLTPQTEQRLRTRFPDAGVVTLHSGLNARERTRAWLAALKGRAAIVLGTRMAVFVPLPRLAMIIVDEEHDPSFKATEGVRYSARDLAVMRARLRDCPIVLGSATPSLESWRRAQQGRYRLLRLSQRAGTGAPHPVPRLHCIDLRAEKPIRGLAPSVREALRQTVASGAQALVFINRRGYAPVVACDACGWLSVCSRCATFAAFHKTDGRLHCHHCGWTARVPQTCPTCGNPALAAVGHGTQRIEEALRELLPNARIERIDRDSTQRRGAAGARLAAVHAGAVDVLVGTQMIAKGHDFRRVTLVVVLNADAQLVAHDFRAPERLFATLMQVAGRAGRAGQPSRVLVQTRFPQHPLFAALAAADYTRFADQQLAERRAAGMPPFVAQALLTAQASSLDRALDFLDGARAIGRRLPGSEQIAIYDPVPMPLVKLAGVHRAQLLAESPHRGALQDWLGRWRAALGSTAARGVRWQLEVDPLRI